MREAGLLFFCIVLIVTFIFAGGDATAKAALWLEKAPNDFAGILLRVKSKCIKVQGKRVCFEDDDGDQDDDDDEPKKKKKKGGGQTSGERSCPAGYVVLEKPNKYGAYCEPKEGLPAKKHLFFCQAAVQGLGGATSYTGRNTLAANEAEARSNFDQSLKDDNLTLKGPVTCTQN